MIILEDYFKTESGRKENLSLRPLTDDRGEILEI